MNERPRLTSVYYPSTRDRTTPCRLEQFCKWVGRPEPELPDNVVELHPEDSLFLLDVPAWLKRQAD